MEARIVWENNITKIENKQSLIIQLKNNIYIYKHTLLCKPFNTAETTLQEPPININMMLKFLSK